MLHAPQCATSEVMSTQIPPHNMLGGWQFIPLDELLDVVMPLLLALVLLVLLVVVCVVSVVLLELLPAPLPSSTNESPVPARAQAPTTTQQPSKVQIRMTKPSPMRGIRV